MLKRFIRFAALAVFLVLLSCSKENPEKQQTTGNSEMWISFDKGLERIEKEKKPAVIDFYTSWCKWCKVMDKKTFSDPQVKSYLAKNFVTIRLNAEDASKSYSYSGKTLNSVQLTRYFGVRGFPSLAYLDKEGKLVTVVPGYIPKDTFLSLLKYMKEECYKKKITFDDFLKKKANCE